MLTWIQESCYNISMALLGLAIRVGSIFNPKLKAWISGRNGQYNRLKSAVGNLPKSAKRYWFHCASLGEFEQGRPVMELLRQQEPEALIFLSFFSPSGYTIRKDYPVADLVFYLPLDLPHAAKKYVALLEPDTFILVKYEFWYNLLRQLHAKQTRLFLISAAFRRKQWFLQPNIQLGKKMLGFFSHFYVQDRQSKEILQQAGIEAVSIAGDTRVDRVLDQAANPKPLDKIRRFVGEANRVLVAGSTWPPDEKIIHDWLTTSDLKNWKIILAPHQIDENHLKVLEETFAEAGTRYSKWESNQASTPLLILDTIGDLSSAYQFATHTYVGGGFGKGIHNLLEAVAYGPPVFYGPKHEKFKEAIELKELAIGQVIQSAADFKEKIGKLEDEQKLTEIRKKAAGWFAKSKGASALIVDALSR
ncbi:MAG: 3-deoxy-D-manno-octulosonic acid transferase [Bacteroidetes bacterium]|nr:3-deoxy-D-manno-octulosonic acid transferase [Bacteroidota bacterium]